jgi:1,4-alpha-glucan branching enzyme
MNATNRPASTTSKPRATRTPQSSGATPEGSPQTRAFSQAKAPQAVPIQGARRAVRFELDVPEVHSTSVVWSVSVAGTFNDWKPGATPLNCLGAGKWTREVPLAPGRYEYRFVVNGEWLDDPKARVSVPNPHGGHNAVVEVA